MELQPEYGSSPPEGEGVHIFIPAEAATLGEHLGVTALNNKSLANELKLLAGKTFPMGKREFHILCEAADRIQSRA